MKNAVIHIGHGKDTVQEIPKPPAYLNNMAKKHYTTMAKYLIKLERLKEIYLPALELYAEAMAQFEFAVREIKLKNKDDYGTGYIQVFRSGASNITAEVSLKNNAESTLLKCFKQFGLDPKSEKDLKQEISNQGDLFEGFKEHLNKKLS